MCKSKRIRISEDLFQHWKDLKCIRKARSDEELVAYLLDLATATDLSDSPRYGKRRTQCTYEIGEFMINSLTESLCSVGPMMSTPVRSRGSRAPPHTQGS